MSELKGERIAKRMAAAGLCSRRDAERWIEDGRVSVDGDILTSPAVTVTEQSVILVDGAPLAAAGPARVWRYHKPLGMITTHKDPQGRPTVFDAMPNDMPRVVSVGRLDINSEGLLLLTTDGELARTLKHPDNGWIRRYRVRIHGRPTADEFKKLERGITIDGVRYGPIKIEIDRQQGANAWVTVSLTEGKNREIRRVMTHLGYDVSRLMRTAYGPFQLGSLKLSEVKEIPGKTLREQLGEEAGKKTARKGRTENRSHPAKSSSSPDGTAQTKIPPRRKKPASVLKLRDKTPEKASRGKKPH